MAANKQILQNLKAKATTFVSEWTMTTRSTGSRLSAMSFMRARSREDTLQTQLSLSKAETKC